MMARNLAKLILVSVATNGIRLRRDKLPTASTSIVEDASDPSAASAPPAATNPYRQPRRQPRPKDLSFDTDSISSFDKASNFWQRKDKDSISIAAANGGKDCTHSDQTVDSQSCGVNCQGEWTEFSQCVEGEKQRHFMISVPASGGGRSCEYAHNLEDKSTCGTACVGAWESWSTCNMGSQTRNYVISQPTVGGGKSCSVSVTTESQNCGTNCVGDWSQWDNCSNGEQFRTYSVSVAVANGGIPCDHENNKSEKQTCGTNCVGDFGVWSACAMGSQTRSFAVSVPMAGGGKECSYAAGTVENQNCGTNCVGSFTDWTACSNGEQFKTYAVSIPAANGGIPCDYVEGKQEKQSCGTTCVGVWGDWSACQMGSQTRTYVQTTPVSGGGKQCSYNNGATETQNCGRNCDGFPFLGAEGEQFCQNGEQKRAEREQKLSISTAANPYKGPNKIWPAWTNPELEEKRCTLKNMLVAFREGDHIAFQEIAGAAAAPPAATNPRRSLAATRDYFREGVIFRKARFLEEEGHRRSGPLSRLRAASRDEPIRF